MVAPGTSKVSLNTTVLQWSARNVNVTHLITSSRYFEFTSSTVFNDFFKVFNNRSNNCDEIVSIFSLINLQ